jgi:hypothetical protein
MPILFRTILLGSILAVFGSNATAQAESASEPGEFIEMQVSSAVGRLQQVAGRVSAPGRPVILVRADLPNEPWWVQGQPVPVGQDGFTAKAIFGSTKSQVGTRFRIVTILVPSNTPATDYRTGQIIRELPDVPRSRELLVTLGRAGRPVIALAPKEGATTSGRTEPEPREKAPVEFTSPKTGESVRQIAELAGKIKDGFTPVVLIRPLAKGSVWWIQKPVKLEKSGEFTAKIVVGNSRTAEGTRFRIVALAVPTKTSRKATATDEFKPGEFLKELPEDTAASEELVLTLRRTDTARKESATRK